MSDKSRRRVVFSAFYGGLQTYSLLVLIKIYRVCSLLIILNFCNWILLILKYFFRIEVSKGFYNRDCLGKKWLTTQYKFSLFDQIYFYKQKFRNDLILSDYLAKGYANSGFE